MFDLLLERQPVALDQFVEGSFFGFVALVVIGFGIGNRHRQTGGLQLAWPCRIALVAQAVALWSVIALGLPALDQRDRIDGPFGRRPNPGPGRISLGDQRLPFIHWVLERLSNLSTLFK